MALFFKFLLNLLFAWIAMVFGILLVIILVTKFLHKNIQNPYINKFFKVINTFLRKNHIKLAYLFLISSIIHGILSSYSLISFNYGSISLIVWILLLYTFIDKKSLGSLWIQKHRELTILLIIVVVAHIFEVGGFVAPSVISTLIYMLR